MVTMTMVVYKSDKGYTACAWNVTKRFAEPEQAQEWLRQQYKYPFIEITII